MLFRSALERMHRYDPELRHVVLVRDPIERLVSQWQMISNRWPQEAESWARFLTRFAPDPADVPESRRPPRTNVHAFRMHSGVVRGHYGAQLRRGIEVFGREAFLVLDMRELLRDHVGTVHRVTDHLGLRRLDDVAPLPHGMKGKPALSPDLPTVEQIAGLVERYAPDLELFARLSGLDVSAWPTCEVAAGRLDVEEFTARLTSRFAAPAPARAAAP